LFIISEKLKLAPTIIILTSLKLIIMKKLSILLILLISSFALSAQIQASWFNKISYNTDFNTKSTILYEQMTPDISGFVVASQEFSDMSNSRLYSADDFIIPTGNNWDINSIGVYGHYWNGSGGPVDNFIVGIYSDNNGLPGTLLYTQSGLPYSESSGLFLIDFTQTISLPAGHYWISVMAHMALDPNGQWGWLIHAKPQINYEFANQDPDQLLGGGWPTTWDSGSNTIGNYDSYDFCFVLYGDPSSSQSVPVSNWAIIFSILLIIFLILIQILFHKRSYKKVL
jgi:hypothetical protein